jgi:hypothetical protein
MRAPFVAGLTNDPRVTVYLCYPWIGQELPKLEPLGGQLARQMGCLCLNYALYPVLYIQ